MPSPAALALRAFERDSRGRDEATIALRLLTLHMLEGLAPGFFERERLGPKLLSALRRGRALPARVEATVDPDVAMARLDALYVRAIRGEEVPISSSPELKALVRRVGRENRLYAWLLGALAEKLGVRTKAATWTRQSCCGSEVEELYYVTHVLLLESDYCARPLDPRRFSTEARLLRSGAKRAVAEGWLDLGAEISFCLAMLGERDHRLLRLLRAKQRRDGRVFEDDAATEIDRLHSTSAALLAFAAEQRRRSGSRR